MIASITTQTGFTVQSRMDRNVYEKGVKISDEQIAHLNITPGTFHSEWNSMILPGMRDG